MNKWISLLALAFVFISCEKDISFNIENQPPKLVVDGQIEEGESPQIVLTSSLNVFNVLTPQLATGSFVRNAKVTISNGTNTHQLKEYQVSLPGGYNLFYYSNDFSNPSTSFIGETGKKYLLKIETTDGKIFNAETNIPFNDRRVDSLWWRKASIDGDSNRAIITGRFFDPPGLGNYVRYFTKINNGAFLAGENSSFDDNVVDGKKYDVQIRVGIDRNTVPPKDPKDALDFRQGDTVTLKLCNIDKASYDFWNTLEFSYGAIGNPFSSPNKVLGNISNGALGVFTGYSVKLKKIVCR